MRALRLAVLVVGLSGLSGGCGWFGGSKTGDDATSADGEDVDVSRYAELARKIKAEPSQGDKILKEAGITREQLDAAMYTIAADPALSAEYVKQLH